MFNIITYYESISQFHTDPLSSTRKFNTNSSTPKAAQFNTPLSFYRADKELFCQFFCVELRAFDVEMRGVWNWGVFGVELRGVLSWGVLMWNWGIPGAERKWPFCVELICWTEGDPKVRPSSSIFLKKSFSLQMADKLNFQNMFYFSVYV